MLPCWDTVLRPFLAALDSGPIIEIGAASGETTVKLAEFAAERERTVHAVDPQPKFDPIALERRFGERFRFHKERSHDALGKIEPAAAVLIDGDHNWYTVHGELALLESIARSAGCRFPLALLHDVEWPYARRDMYYDPEAIPSQWRKPWERRGIEWGKSPLSTSGGGVNPHLANALEEGGPRNGVLTAVEDFLDECAMALQLRIVHGEAGIGVLLPDDLLNANPEIRRRWDDLTSTDFLLAQAERLSKAAAAATAGHREAARQTALLRRQPEEATQERQG